MSRITYYRNGHSLPCGLSKEYQTVGTTLPKKSEFDYRYATPAVNIKRDNQMIPSNETLRRDDHIFIDPRTGLMYNANSIKRGDVSGTRYIHNDCYQHTSVASASHIYDCPNYDDITNEDNEH